MTGGLIFEWFLGYNFSVALWVGYIALFGIAVETGVVMVVYLHEALDHRLASFKRCAAPLFQLLKLGLFYRGRFSFG